MAVARLQRPATRTAALPPRAAAGVQVRGQLGELLRVQGPQLPLRRLRVLPAQRQLAQDLSVQCPVVASQLQDAQAVQGGGQLKQAQVLQAPTHRLPHHARTHADAVRGGNVGATGVAVMRLERARGWRPGRACTDLEERLQVAGMGVGQVLAGCGGDGGEEAGWHAAPGGVEAGKVGLKWVGVHGLRKNEQRGTTATP